MNARYQAKGKRSLLIGAALLYCAFLALHVIPAHAGMGISNDVSVGFEKAYQGIMVSAPVSVRFPGAYGGAIPSHPVSVKFRDAFDGIIPQASAVSVAAQEPVAIWNMDIDWRDSSVHALDANPLGGPEVIPFGMVSNSGTFDGVDDYLDMGTSDFLRPMMRLTLVAWVRAGTGMSGEVMLAGDLDPLSATGYGISIAGDQAIFSLGDGTLRSVSAPMPLGVWVFVAGTYDGQSQKLYMDGELVASSEGTFVISHSQPFTVGHGTGGAFFSGELDELSLYLRSLNEDEIMSMYAIDKGIDIFPPVPPTVDAVASLTNSPTITLHGTKDADASILINSKTVLPYNDSMTWEVLYDLIPGENILKVTSEDFAGNESDAVETTVIFDNAPPTVLGTIPDNNSTGNALDTIEILLYDYYAGLDIQNTLSASAVESSRGMMVEGEWAAIDGGVGFTPSNPFRDDSYTVRLYPVDTLGNRIEYVFDFILDTAKPVLESIELTPQGLVGAEELFVVLNFAEDMSTEVGVSVTYDTAAPYDNHVINGSWYDSRTWLGVFTPAHETADGSYTMSIGGARDLAGNVMDTVQAGDFVLDTTPPAAPLLNDVPALTNSVTITLSGGKEAGASIHINSTEVIPHGEATSWSVEYHLDEGLNNVPITAMDAAGNESTPANASVTLDTTAPVLAGTVPDESSAVFGATRIEVLLSDGAAGLSLGESLADSWVASGDLTVAGQWTVEGNRLVFVPTQILADGQYYVNVNAYDMLGNVSLLSFGFVVDTVAPTVDGLIMIPESPHGAEKVDFQVTFSDTMDPTSPLSVSFGTYAISGAWTGPATWIGTYEFSNSVGDGQYFVEVGNASDMAGNTMTTVNAGGFVLDTTPPLPLTIDSFDSPVNNANLVLKGQKAPDTVCYIDGVLMGAASTDTEWAHTASLNEGPNELSLYCSDAAGNSSEAASAMVVLDTQAPVIDSSIPAAGAAVPSLGSVSVLFSDAVTGVDLVNTLSTAGVTRGDMLIPGEWTVRQDGSVVYVPEAPFSDGSYSVNITPLDILGNSRDVLLVFAIDSALPTVDSFSMTPPSPHRAESVMFAIAFNESMDTAVSPLVTVDRGILSAERIVTGSWLNDRSWRGAYVFTAETGDGTYVVEASGAKDLAGNTMTAADMGTFVLDTEAPGAPTLNVLQSPTNVPNQTLSGERPAGSSIIINGRERVAPGENALWSYLYALREGLNSISISTSDEAGNLSEPFTGTVTLDTTPPAFTLDLYERFASSPAVTLTGRKEPGAVITVNGIQIFGPDDVSSEWSYSAALMEGLPNTFLFIASDALGNVRKASASIYFDAAAPAALAPGILTVDENGDGTVVGLSWSAYVAPPDVGYYRVYISDAPFDDVVGLVPLTTIDRGVSVYDVSGLNEGSTYYFTVVPVDMGGNFESSVHAVAGSPTDTVAPEDVTGLVATAGYSGETGHWIGLSWTPSLNSRGDLWGQKVYIDAGDGYDQGTPLAADAVEYMVSGLVADHAFKARVTELDDSGYESVGAVIIASTSLPAPTGVTTEPGNELVSIGWNPSSPQYLDYYNVYRAESASQINDVSAMQLVASTTTTSYVDTGLTNGKTYQYAVTAVNDYGAESVDAASSGALTRMDVTGPNISGFSLTQGQVLTQPVLIAASAADAESDLDRMEVYIDGSLIANAAGSEISVDWNIVFEADGNHVVKLAAYDEHNNASTVTSGVIVSLARPPVPVILGHEVLSGALQNTVSLYGTSIDGAYVELRLNGVVIINAPVSDGAFTFGSIGVIEGGNALAVKAVHRGGASLYTEDYIVTIDTGAPPVPYNLYAQRKAGGVVSLSWEPGDGEVAAGYNLYESNAYFTSKNDPGVSAVNPDEIIKYTYKEYLPDNDDVRYYAVSAVDSSGNESEISPAEAIASDRVPPAVVQVDYTYFPDSGDAVSPVDVAGPGSVAVELTVNEVLGETPFFSLEPPSGSPIVVNLQPVDDLHYTGTIAITKFGSRGVMTYKFSGRDVLGNRGNSTGDAFTIDVSGPRVSVLSPLTLLQITSGAVPVELEFDEPVLGLPVLELRAADGSHVTVNELSTGDGLHFSGILNASDMPEGNASFVMAESYDYLGNMGTGVLSGNTILLYNDTVPPPPVPTGVETVTGIGGKVDVRWNPMSGGVSFNLWRRAEGAAEPELLGAGLSDNALSDTPEVDGLYYYSVSAVGLLESQSERSQEVAAVSDRQGPAAPTGLVLTLSGTGVTATWTPSVDSDVYGYQLYRLSSADEAIDSLEPIAKVLNDRATDPAPRKAAPYYVVVAVDDLRNPGPPSLVAEIDIPVPPLPGLMVEHINTNAPVLRWTKPFGDVQGYHIYRNGIKITKSGPVQVTSYTDGYYAGGTMRYGVSVVDSYGAEGPVREAVLSPMKAMAAEGTVLRRGLLENMGIMVTNGYDVHVRFHEMTVRVGTASPTAVAATPELNPGETSTIQKVLATTSDASGTVPVVVTLEWDQAPGTSVRVVRTSSVEVAGASTALEIFNTPLVRNTEGLVQLKFNNLGSALMEVVTSQNNGPTKKVTINLRDQDGNLLATGNLDQRTGDVVNISGAAVARLEPGGSFLTLPVRVQVPEGAPNRVLVEAVIENTYYNFGKPDQVEAPGMSMSVAATIVDVPYYAYAEPEHEFYANAQPVLITGQALDTVTGAAVANVPVRLGVSVKGFDRFVEVTTGPDGAFSHTFEPGAKEAGLYSIWAAHPDVKDRSVQASFAIAGFRVAPEGGTIRMGLNSTVNVPVTLTNFGGAGLTGLSLITNSTEGIAALVSEPDSGVLAAGQASKLNFAVTATGDAPGVGFASMTATVAEGLEAEVRMDVTTVAQVPAMRVNPTYIDTGLTRGTKKLATFTLSNIGYEPLRGARIDGLVYPWMSVASGRELDEIAPGQVKEIALMLEPGQEVPAGVYDDKITVYSENHTPMDYYVQVTVTSDDKGSVVFDVLNEFYEDVAGAAIVVQNDQLYELVYTVQTGSDGTVMLADIPEGYYRYNISAPGHEPWSGMFAVEPGLTATVPIALQLNLVSVEWSVTPVVLEDRYEITVSQTFETKVPAPIVILEPASINVPDMAVGEVFYGEIRATNHGLVAARNLELDIPSKVGDYEIEVLMEAMPEKLDAQQTIVIPYRITRVTSPVGMEGYGGGCQYNLEVKLKYEYTICPETPNERDCRTSTSLYIQFTAPCGLSEKEIKDLVADALDISVNDIAEILPVEVSLFAGATFISICENEADGEPNEGQANYKCGTCAAVCALGKKNPLIKMDRGEYVACMKKWCRTHGYDDVNWYGKTCVNNL